MSITRPVMLALFLLACVAPSGGCATRLVSEGQTRQFRWGTPVDGLQAGLAVNDYRPGNRAWLSVTYAIRNVSQQSLLIVSLPYYTGAERYFPTRGPLEVRVGSERQPRWIEPLTESPPPEAAYEFLEPGEQVTLTGGIDPGHYRLGGMFQAELTFVYESPPPAAADAAETTEGRAPAWSGRARSAPVKVRVRF